MWNVWVDIKVCNQSDIRDREIKRFAWFNSDRSFFHYGYFDSFYFYRLTQYDLYNHEFINNVLIITNSVSLTHISLVLSFLILFLNNNKIVKVKVHLN